MEFENNVTHSFRFAIIFQTFVGNIIIFNNFSSQMSSSLQEQTFQEHQCRMNLMLHSIDTDDGRGRRIGNAAIGIWRRRLQVAEPTVVCHERATELAQHELADMAFQQR